MSANNTVTPGGPIASAATSTAASTHHVTIRARIEAILMLANEPAIKATKMAANAARVRKGSAMTPGIAALAAFGKRAQGPLRHHP